MENFEAIGLKPEIIEAITALGFEKPTPVQQQAIPFLLSSKQDLIALAQTGTGKTAAFGLPVINQIDPKNKNVQALVLCPTRELCLQITKELGNYLAKSKDIQVTAVYGGESIDKQIRQLRRGVHIVAGTPGRTLDLIKREKLKIDNIQWLVLDEADEMLSMGFKDDLDAILSQTPDEKQTLLFSATMPYEMKSIVRDYMTDPMELSAGKKNVSADTVEHTYCVVAGRHKYEALKRIANIHPNIYGIIFCRTRKETKAIADQLGQDHYNADAIHGDLSQAQRELVMHRFRNRHLQLLVATDVAARGIDVNDLSHVINYQLPDTVATYIHRTGRTGRAGKEGMAISLVSGRERDFMRSVERKIGKKVIKKMIPTGQEICERQLFTLIDKVKNVEVNEEQISPYLEATMEKLSVFEREELIKRFVSVEFNRFLKDYEDAPDLNDFSRERRKPSFDHGGRRGGRGSGRNGYTRYKRFFINVGTSDHLTAPRLLGLINEQFHGEKVPVGKIELLRNFSFFEIDQQFATKLPSRFNGVTFEGKGVEVEEAQAKRRNHDRSYDRGGRGGGGRGGYGNNNSSGRKRIKRKRKYN